MSIITIAPGPQPTELGATPGFFRLTLDTPAPPEGLTLTYTTSGTATPNVDYTALSGTVTFAPGSTTASIKVIPVLDANNNEGTLPPNIQESVIVTLLEPPSGSTVSGSPSATLTIADGFVPTRSTATVTTIPTPGGNLILGSNAIDGVVGTNLNDVIYGYAGNDTMLGNDGNDYLDGGAGNDVVAGSGGNDTVVGGTGDDVYIGAFTANITPGLGEKDVFVGGPGSDLYILADRGRTYYLGSGVGEYALIQNFDSSDRIQYLEIEPPTIGPSPAGLPSGSALFVNGDLIAILQDIPLGTPINLIFIPTPTS